MTERVNINATNVRVISDIHHDRFDDPFTQQVAWTPLKCIGSFINIQHHGIHYLNHKVSNRQYLVFKASLIQFIFAVIPFLVGLTILAVIAWQFISQDNTENIDAALMVGIPFSVIGYMLYLRTSKARIFDLKAGTYSGHFAIINGRQSIDLQRVKALQIINVELKWSVRCQLNLVLTDTTRLSVIDCGEYNRVLMDAKELAKVLDVPLWDNA